MTPRETMIKVMREATLGDYGHDLPDAEFEHQVDRLLAGLKDAGFAIYWMGSGAAGGLTKMDMGTAAQGKIA